MHAVGHALRVVVTASNVAGTASATSGAAGEVARLAAGDEVGPVRAAAAEARYSVRFDSPPPAAAIAGFTVSIETAVASSSTTLFGSALPMVPPESRRPVPSLFTSGRLARRPRAAARRGGPPAPPAPPRAQPLHPALAWQARRTAARCDELREAGEDALFDCVEGAIELGVKYAEKRGAAIFEPTDSAADKILYIYRLLVHDKSI